jgi:hypothetical protein
MNNQNLSAKSSKKKFGFHSRTRSNDTALMQKSFDSRLDIKFLQKNI